MTFVVLVIIPYAFDYKVVSAEGIEPSTYSLETSYSGTG
jgi:hypothetical protein